MIIGALHDPTIRKTYLKKIKVECPNCQAIHEYPIRVQGITGVRIFCSSAVDSDHHCKTCGYQLEEVFNCPLPYIPDPEEVKLKRCESEIRKRKKSLIKERLFVTGETCMKLHPKRHYRNMDWYLERRKNR